MRRSVGHWTTIGALLVAAGLTAGGCGVDLTGKQSVGADGGTGSPMGGDKGSSGGQESGGGSSGASGDDASDDDQGTSDDGGGFSGSSSSGNGGDDGSGPPPLSDGGGGGGSQCDFSGLWAVKITIPVNWVPQGLTSVILASGSGVIEQWILSNRTVQGLATTEDAAVCGITLPDFDSTGLAGAETYGVRFPDMLFDNGFIPRTMISGMMSDTTPSAHYSTVASAVLIGLTLNSATTAVWPATITSAEQVDSDNDGKPGVTAEAATGSIAGKKGDSGTYLPIPVDLTGDRASQIYVAIRQVTALSGTASDCDHLSGSVTIPKIPSPSAITTPKYAIDSHVIGCGLVAGTDCTPAQTSFIDGTQPVFSPTGNATFKAMRMPGGTCPMVRQALP